MIDPALFRWRLAALWLLAIAVAMLCPRALAGGPTLVVELPEGTQIRSGAATALKLEIKGEVVGRAITFSNLLPDTPYDVKITLSDGTVLAGADMAWYAPAAKTENFDPLDDEDRAQIKELFNGIKAFENKRTILAMEGNHDHVTILAELIRDNGFHSAAGEEIIWRVELWYFKNQHGGWEKINQQNKVLRRERFKSKKEYEAAVGKLRWAPELGGIRMKKEEARKIAVDLSKMPAEAGK